MWIKSLTRVAAELLAGGQGGGRAPSDEVSIDLQALTADTQERSNRRESIDLVWWFPIEWWKAEVEMHSPMTQRMREAALNELRPDSDSAEDVSSMSGEPRRRVLVLSMGR
jgi:hypothetical protein